MNVEIYTKPDCVYCTKLKNLLSSRNTNYVEYKLNEDFTTTQLKEKFPHAKTFPVVIVDGFMIGGFTEYSNMVKLNEQRNSSQKLLNESI
jgi:glutaredoxin